MMKDSNATTNVNGMTREEKDLVLHDLCARLPYGVKCQFEDTIRIIDGESSSFYDYVLSAHHLELFLRHNNFYIKPYLRPMSSMTKEEREELKELTAADIVTNSGFGYENLRGMCFGMMYIDCQELIDWLNKKMFDFRGLIPKDLALSTEVFNPYKD